MTYHEQFADLSRWFWIETANHLWQSTLFFLLVLIIAAVLRNAPAKSRYTVWLLASSKFALPLVMFASLGKWLNIGNLFPPAASVVLRSAPADINLVNIVSNERVATEVISTAQTVSAVTAHNEVCCLLTILWAIGCVSLFVLWGKRSRSFKATLGYRNKATPEREIELFNNAQARLSLKTRVSLIISDSIPEPLVLGVWRPAVVIPAGLPEKLTDDELELVLMHELAHIARRDNLVGILQMIMCCLLWFYLPVWFVRRKILEERERVCDETVLSHEDKPRSYASGLLKVAQFGLHLQHSAGLAGAAGANLKKRLELIMKDKMKNTNTKWQRWIVGTTITIFVLICVVSGFSISRADSASSSEPAAGSTGDKETAAKFQQVEIYADGKLVNTMELRSPKPNLTMFSYALYRIPEGQRAQTSDGQKIYVFQIIPTQQADSVKIEIVALLEDLSTASNSHPIYEFKRQTVATYSLSPGERAVVSEMSQLGVRPLQIRVTEFTATEKESAKTDNGFKTVTIQKGEELPDVSYKIVGNDDSPLKITEATGPQVTNALYTKLTGQTTVTTGADGKTVFPNVYGAPIVKMINNSGKTITGLIVAVIDPRPAGSGKWRGVIQPQAISIPSGQTYTVNFRETHESISEKYWLAGFTDPANFYVTVSKITFEDGTSWRAKEEPPGRQ
jgi:beta-lactamase regulating signal transducer with metallopeptidase domain